MLLLFVLNWFTGERWRAAFVAAIFAVHPVNVETVAWIAERKDLLGTFFFLLGFLAYGQYLERRGAAAYLLLVLIFVLGLMASPIVIMFPLALFLFDCWPLRYFEMGIGWRRILYEKLPLIGLSLLAAVVTFFVHKKAGVLSVFDTVPRMLRAENALDRLCALPRQNRWPANLYIPYRYSETYERRHVLESPPSFSSRYVAAIFFSGAPNHICSPAGSGSSARSSPCSDSCKSALTPWPTATPTSRPSAFLSVPPGSAPIFLRAGASRALPSAGPACSSFPCAPSKHHFNSRIGKTLKLS